MKHLKLTIVLFVFLICTSYNKSEDNLDSIKESLDKSEQSIKEINKILDNPYYKYEIK